MKRTFLNKISVGFGIALISMAFAVTSPAQVESEEIDMPRIPDSKVTIREGQLIQFTVADPAENRPITVINPTSFSGDVDMVAFDTGGNEIDRSTFEFGPRTKMSFTIYKAFSEIKGDEIASVYVTVSLRPKEAFGLTAASLPIAFFSQLDARWADKKVGASGKTIKQIGCAVTSISMAAASKMSNLTPLTMNAYLSSAGGYTSDGSIYWAKPADYQPSTGFKFIGSSVNGVSTIKDAASLKALIDGKNYVVTSSTRFASHWVVIYKYNNAGTRLSDFEYLDPADSSYIRRTVDDGMVKASSQIRVYK